MKIQKNSKINGATHMLLNIIYYLSLFFLLVIMYCKNNNDIRMHGVVCTYVYVICYYYC